MFASSFARRTIAFLTAGVLALLAIVAVSAWLSVRTAQHAEEAVVERDIRALTTNLLAATIDAETGQRGYLLTGEARYLNPFERAQPRLRGDVAALRKLVAGDPAQLAAVDELSEVLDAKMAELTETIEQTKAGQRDAAIQTVLSDRGRLLMEKARTQLAHLISTAESRVAARLEAVTEGAEILTWVTAAGSFLIVLFAAGASWTVMNYTRELMAARIELQALNAGLEERVAERTEALTRANDEIQRFAYIVSHDLRSPLVNIMGFTSELEAAMKAVGPYVAGDTTLADKARLATEEDIPEALRFIRASTGKMDGLINAILKLSREGRRELRPEPVDLVTLFKNAAASVRHQTDEVGAEIAVPSSAPALVTDRLAMEQVVGNVVDNAVKYLARERPGRIVITTGETTRRVHIDITDNGRGIAEQDHERIFELFRRAGAQDRPGEGIGLAHVRALVRRLGGDITVQSELGSGTTFRIDLPRRLRVNENSTTR
ncbi:CHASE3 domain-containing protein [Reyranella sp.]|uniref:sensor histidine kinase n=1 Tax=Reyranella sp. TaxID=1929291 RepID=UPI0026117F30|nr:CHASE3 domain-containing protein [Reyranella sp.]HQT15558.1 CHASE3 domain-containing protein [Reyranella sp.]